MSQLRGYLVLAFGFLSVAVVIIMMFLFNSKHRLIRKIWAKMQMVTMGVNFKIFGDYDKEAKIYIINHRSMLDIIALESLLDNNPAWIGKKEITDIPFFGNIMKLPRMITIDREDKRGLIKLVKEVGERLDEGRVIMIFPEGTRSASENLRKFKSGAKILAEKYKLKVQPVVLVGTEKIMNPKSTKIVPGELEVHYLESFMPEKDTPWYEDLEEKMGTLFKERFNATK